MISTKINSSVKVKFCSKDKCIQNTEYFCQDCQKDFCLKCHKEHATSLDTKHHGIARYRNRGWHIPNKNETCSIHLDCTYQTFCESCNIPICAKCKGHRKHKKLELVTAYKIKQKQVKEHITIIRSDTIYQFQVILKELKDDVKNCRGKMKLLQYAMGVMSRRIKNSMDEVVIDNSYLKNVHRCLSQVERMKSHVNKIQFYEQIHERLMKRPVQFLQFIKKLRPPSVEDTPNLHLHSLMSMIPDINVKDLMNPFTKIRILKRGKRQIEKKKLLKIKLPVFTIDSYMHVVEGVYRCHHISCVTPDRVWVSDGNSLILADTTTGVTLKRLPILPNGSCLGLHSVNSESELIYIENVSTVNKYCNDLTTKTVLTLKKRRNTEWFPLCLYCSPSTGDLLIGKKRFDTNESRITRYNKLGKLTQTIQNDTNGQALFKFPRFITENNNGDVVVSDIIDRSHGAVVVTDRYGRHRFSYTGRPNGSEVLPLGICTDAFSNILVCDFKSGHVHVIEENGQFGGAWRHIYNQFGRTLRPMSLSYDVNTHLLWVGSLEENVVHAFRYIYRHPHLTDKIDLFDEVDVSKGQKAA